MTVFLSIWCGALSLAVAGHIVVAARRASWRRFKEPQWEAGTARANSTASSLERIREAWRIAQETGYDAPLMKAVKEAYFI